MNAFGVSSVLATLKSVLGSHFWEFSTAVPSHFVFIHLRPENVCS